MAIRVLARPPVSISPAPLTAWPASFNSITGEVAARLTEILSIKCSSTPALAGIAGPGRTGSLQRQHRPCSPRSARRCRLPPLVSILPSPIP